MLKTPDRSSLVEQCTDTLRRAILSGDFAAGERLPPERRLSDELQVNRVTLRAALGRLAAEGLLATRQGSGHTVQDFRQAGGPSILPGLTELAEEQGRLGEVVSDLLRVRRHLALAALELIAARRPDPTPVRDAVEAFAEALDQGPDAVAEADAAVLAAVLDATGSPVLALCLNPVREVLGRCTPLRRAMFREPRGNLAGWQALVAWMEAPTAPPTLILGLLEERDAATLRAGGWA